jgi:hypothetical protein
MRGVLMTQRTCDRPDCERPHRARGLCGTHYDQWQRTEAPARPRCSIDPCEKPALKRGWCDMHYQRWHLHGDPLRVIVRTRSMCGAESCGRYAVSHGFCETHNRQRVEGKPLTPIRTWRPNTERDAQGRKQCRSCAQWLPEEQFGKNSRNPDGLGYQCKKCNRDKHRLANYGMTWGQYQALLDAQGGGCAVCGQTCASGRLLAVDHDHSCCPENSRSCVRCVRGLLCGGCNQGLGKFRDDPRLLAEAAAYLARHRGAL